MAAATKLVRVHAFTVDVAVGDLFNKFFDDSCNVCKAWHTMNGGSSDSFLLTQWIRTGPVSRARSQRFAIEIPIYGIMKCVEEHRWTNEEGACVYEGKNCVCPGVECHFRLEFRRTGGEVHVDCLTGMTLPLIPLRKRITEESRAQYARNFKNLETLMRCTPESASIPSEQPVGVVRLRCLSPRPGYLTIDSRGALVIQPLELGSDTRCCEWIFGSTGSRESLQSNMTSRFIGFDVLGRIGTCAHLVVSSSDNSTNCHTCTIISSMQGEIPKRLGSSRPGAA
jgi:hypothetical protein